MSSKRSADVISTLSSTASSSSGGASSDKKRPKHDERKHPPPADMHVDPTRACLLNPDVPLAKIMLFLDIADIPSAARTCKCWRDLLSTIEDELWLGLVRKHVPSVERITALLPDHVEKAKNVASGDIPPPSRSWKRQFQRHRLIRARNHLMPPLLEYYQPLDSYYFEVQYTFDDEVKSQVSIVIESAFFSAQWPRPIFINLRHKRDLIAEQLTAENELHKNTSLNVLVRIFEKSTGRQAILWDRSQYYFIARGSTHRILAQVLSSHGEDDRIEVKVKSGLRLVVDHSGMVQIGLYFTYAVDAEIEENWIEEETVDLDKQQILDILQNKLAWK